MTTVVGLSRLVLALTFLVSGLAKVADRPGTRSAVIGFGLPRVIAAPLAIVLPVVELGIAGALAAGPAVSRLASFGAVALLVAFTVLIARSLRKGDVVECRCFGALSDKPVGPSALFRNGALLALAGIVALASDGQRGVSLPAWWRATPGREVAVALALVLLTAATVALGRLALTLMGRYGALLVRVEQLERSTGPGWRNPERRPAPAFTLPLLTGPDLSLADAVAATPDQRLLVVFMAVDCVPCGQLARKLPALNTRLGGQLPVLAVVTGNASAVRDKLGGIPAYTALVAPGYDQQAAYGVTGSPSAVVVASGEIVAGPVGGVDAIEQLWESAATTPVNVPAQHTLHAVQQRPRGAGESVADLAVTRPDGTHTTLGEALAGSPRSLLYWDSTCSYCDLLVPDLAPHFGDPSVLVLSRDAVGTGGPLGDDVVYVGKGVGEALALPGTPSAVRIDEGGRLASPIAAGGPAVLELLAGDLSLT